MFRPSRGPPDLRMTPFTARGTHDAVLRTIHVHHPTRVRHTPQNPTLTRRASR